MIGWTGGVPNDRLKTSGTLRRERADLTFEISVMKIPQPS